MVAGGIAAAVARGLAPEDFAAGVLATEVPDDCFFSQAMQAASVLKRGVL
jgi:hypothetical protein